MKRTCLLVIILMLGGLISGICPDVEAGFEGNSNTFYGIGAGPNTTGDDDYATFIGYRAGYSNTTGSGNTFLGTRAGYTNTTGFSNTFLGLDAGYSNTTGNYNTLVGFRAGLFNTTANSNTFVGYAAGQWNTTGYYNTFLGSYAGFSNTTGNNNTFLGNSSGYSNTTGISNIFLGYLSGFNNSTGRYNTFLGIESGKSNTTGNANTFLGNSAGYSNTTGSGSVFLGYQAGYNETGSNRLYIHNSNTATPLIYGEFDSRNLIVYGNLEVVAPYQGLVYLSNTTDDSTPKVSRMVLNHYTNTEEPVYLFGAASTPTNNFVAFGGGNTIGNAATQIDLFTAPNTTTPVGYPRLTIIGNGYVGIGTQTPSYPLQMAGGAYTNGTTWFNASSRELKESIEVLSTEEALEAIRELNPVKYAYKIDQAEKRVGFIAEETPELVSTKDRKGLSPMDIVAVLTKVVQQQQKMIQEQQKVALEQQRIINDQYHAISALSEGLRELKEKVR